MAGIRKGYKEGGLGAEEDRRYFLFPETAEELRMFNPEFFSIIYRGRKIVPPYETWDGAVETDEGEKDTPVTVYRFHTTDRTGSDTQKRILELYREYATRFAREVAATSEDVANIGRKVRLKPPHGADKW